MTCEACHPDCVECKGSDLLSCTVCRDNIFVK